MITFLIVMLMAMILQVPSDWIRYVSTDASLIIFCLFIISDIHIFLWALRSEKK